MFFLLNVDTVKAHLDPIVVGIGVDAMKTGMLRSPAITVELAKGKDVREAIHIAKDFITVTIKNGFWLNQCVGPVNHAAYGLLQEK